MCTQHWGIMGALALVQEKCDPVNFLKDLSITLFIMLEHTGCAQDEWHFYNCCQRKHFLCSVK